MPVPDSGSGTPAGLRHVGRYGRLFAQTAASHFRPVQLSSGLSISEQSAWFMVSPGTRFRRAKLAIRSGEPCHAAVLLFQLSACVMNSKKRACKDDTTRPQGRLAASSAA
ncbi:hypothetical protein CMUS01_14721 [Colletotrichum musicola]|uniref:Uncharacterized protein n=1 Tax=Colletotrichum musicola TaxID=2175873 RepID=A0A8H6J236_9PEZI|nr:hypothetical protein CMUS01_14721 [Colletotrichum musicola]